MCMKNYIISKIIEVIYHILKQDLSYFDTKHGMKILEMYEDLLNSYNARIDQRSREHIQAFTSGELRGIIEREFLKNNEFIQRLILELNKFQLHK